MPDYCTNCGAVLPAYQVLVAQVTLCDLCQIDDDGTAGADDDTVPELGHGDA